jgi:hypothetical protein
VRAPETVSTHRLTLRRPVAADVEAIFDYTSDPAVTRLLGWPQHTSVADTHDFLRFSDQAWAAGPGPYVIVDEGAVVGSTGLEVETPHRAATGMCSPARQSRGYATEVARRWSGSRSWASGGCAVPRAGVGAGAGEPASRARVLRRHTVFPNVDPTSAQDVECWAGWPRGRRCCDAAARAARDRPDDAADTSRSAATRRAAVQRPAAHPRR